MVSCTFSRIPHNPHSLTRSSYFHSHGFSSFPFFFLIVLFFYIYKYLNDFIITDNRDDDDICVANITVRDFDYSVESCDISFIRLATNLHDIKCAC